MHDVGITRHTQLEYFLDLQSNFAFWGYCDHALLSFILNEEVLASVFIRYLKTKIIS